MGFPFAFTNAFGRSLPILLPSPPAIITASIRKISLFIIYNIYYFLYYYWILFNVPATNNGKIKVASATTFTLAALGFIFAQLIASSWFPPESEPSYSLAVVM